MIVESFLNFLSKIFFFTSFVNNKGTFPQPLCASEEERLLKLAKEGDGEARELLIRHNLRLVAHIVKKYSNAGEADDLISVGTIGLIKGIETYESDKGSQLATYAAKCIDNEILMYIRANKKHRVTVSLSESVGIDKEGNEITLMDILPQKQDNAYTEVENALIMQRIRSIIQKSLTKREYKIISMRYALDSDDTLTQMEVAKLMNISRSYVSRIEKKAIAKIAKELN